MTSNHHGLVARPFTNPALHEADARLIIAGIVLVLFVCILGVEVYGCFFQPIEVIAGGHALITYGYCHDIHDFKDMMEPFAGAVFTALGASVGFFFSDRRR